MKNVLKLVAVSILCASLFPQAAVAQIQNDFIGNYDLSGVGLTERFTTQSSMSGVNLSTMLSWNPNYRLNSVWQLEGQLGGTVMKSDVGSFFASRLQLGTSLHNIMPESWGLGDRLVPEFLVGAENWNTKEAGTYAVGSMNLHYRLNMGEQGFWKAIESVHVGYQWILDAPSAAQQYTLGLRLTPFWETKTVASASMDSY